ncbi:putative phosphoribosyl-aminoimidazole-succinocarboxamide synthase [Erysiphe necator]|uniref:Phosphoribosylaminoimidazole-succinocarboxamide synthase n=1 Tax=Uncinula necator TaxID=52586 RepID=A0A0B1PAL9_UNCNE|nr:putative phosphoribosyl-aminoimidazole-succinocarboxamide synthase [Erysiphe necator]
MFNQALTSINIDCLPKTAEGKARNLYEVDSKTLLFVATDRISAYDAIMKNGIPEKGILLTLLSAHWFKILPTYIPGLQTHFISLSLPSVVDSMPNLKANLLNRAMLVKRLKVFPLEAIVRGYITGSAWKEYQRSGTVHGLLVAEGLQESEAFPQGPIYTPSTKAALGDHDENISPAQAVEIIGDKYAHRIEALALQIYKVAQNYAAERGIIIADTKFEFGLDEDTDEVVLVDEVLTPDSSRFWSMKDYKIGRGQPSYDKQFLRDWLTRNNLQGLESISMPDEIVNETGKKYKEAFEKLTGQTFQSKNTSESGSQMNDR